MTSTLDATLPAGAAEAQGRKPRRLSPARIGVLRSTPVAAKRQV